MYTFVNKKLVLQRLSSKNPLLKELSVIRFKNYNIAKTTFSQNNWN